ncbi:MAG: hypothetical protein BVN35_14395 [Proteobacteria bacterium ST_bin11]|nr:MAG: hypothetical protein BVN35_14395 [Proteobacteria bacterium ST_bin11]
MNRFYRLLLVVCGLCLGQSAQAHVSFANLGTDPTGTVSHTLNAYKAYGWIDGTDADLGDSHAIGGASARWYIFTLTKAANVDISFIQNTAGLDPAFTLYRGAFFAGSHDWADYDTVNPVDENLNPIASPTDSDPSGLYLKHSGYRDTLNQTYEGQFDAFGDWSMANYADQWVKLEYVIAVGATSDTDPSRGLTWGGNGNHNTAVGTGEILANYFLPAGTYSIAAGGERCNTALLSCTNPIYRGTMSLTVHPAAVPLPSAVWLFGSALAGFSFNRKHARKQSSAVQLLV